MTVQKQPKPNNAEAVESLVMDGWYIEDIAEALGLTVKYVTWIIGQYDLWEFAKHKPKEERKMKVPSRIPNKDLAPRFPKEEFLAECQELTAREMAEKYSCIQQNRWCVRR